MVCIPKDQARKVVLDLEYLKALKQADSINVNNIDSLVRLSSIKDGIISDQEKQKEIFQAAIRDYQVKDTLYQAQTKADSKKISGLKLQRDGLIVVAVIAILRVLIK